MSWIVTPADYRYRWYLRWLFALRARFSAPVAEPVRLWGRTPRVLMAFIRLYRAIDRKGSPLEPALRSLLMVRISQINVCPFCVDLNASHALERGIAEDKLWGLAEFEGSALFTAREKAALAFAEAMTITGRSIDSGLQARLRAEFTDDAIVELAALIAFQNMSSKFNMGLDVAPAGVCRVPLAATNTPS